MSRKKQYLAKVGETQEGKSILGGVYKTYETHGIPLEVLFSVLADQDALPCWVTFHQEATDAGMKPSRVLSMLEPAIQDAYGDELAKIVVDRLSRLS